MSDEDISLIRGCSPFMFAVHPTLVDYANLGSSSRQPGHAAEYAVEKFTTPVGSPLTNANIAAAINAAIEYVATHGGGTVLIPNAPSYGFWAMGMNDSIQIVGGQNNDGSWRGEVWLQAASYGSFLAWPIGSTVDMIRFRGSPMFEGDTVNHVVYYGGLIDLNVGYVQPDSSNTGRAFVLDACVFTELHRCRNFNMQAGIGFCCRDFAGGNNNSQYVQMFGCRSSGARVSFDLQALTNSQIFGALSHASQEIDFRINGCGSLMIYGGHFQSQCDTKVLIGDEGKGANHVLLQGMYCEGYNTASTFFRVIGGDSGDNMVTIDHVTSNHPPPAYFLDVVGEHNSVTIVQSVGVNGKIRMGGVSNSIHARGIGSPRTNPEQWVLTPESAGSVYCEDRGRVYAHGCGLEDTGSLLDLFASQPGAVVLDPGIAAKVSQVGGVLSSLKDALSTGVATSEPGAEPTWLASDPLFNNQPSFVCSVAGSRCLSMQLPVPYPAGTHVSMFVVFRSIGLVSSVRRPFVVSYNADYSEMMWLAGDDANQPGGYYAIYQTQLGFTFIVDTSVVADTFAHTAWSTSHNSDSGRGLLAIDARQETVGVNPAGAGSRVTPVTQLLIGGSTFGGADVAIAFAAITAGSPVEVLKRAASLARQRFGCPR